MPNFSRPLIGNMAHLLLRGPPGLTHRRRSRVHPAWQSGNPRRISNHLITPTIAEIRPNVVPRHRPWPRRAPFIALGNVILSRARQPAGGRGTTKNVREIFRAYRDVVDVI